MEAWKNDSAVMRLSGGIKIPTVSTGSLGTFNYAPFDQFKEYLKTTYPLVFQNTENVEVNQYGWCSG
jgi:carboxypeptidase PM20D1